MLNFFGFGKKATENPQKTSKKIKKIGKNKKTKLAKRPTNTRLKIAEIKHMEDDFICAICLKFIVNISISPCGHSFCSYCLKIYLLYLPVD